ncbi:MAG TPA: hypothetical protein VIF32_11705 [Gemmatimonadaceae bacterium]
MRKTRPKADIVCHSERSEESALRVVRLRDGKLYYQRHVNRAGEELIPIDDHTFALGETARFEFLRQG